MCCADNGLLAGALPLVVAGRTVGLVRAELLPLLRQAAEFSVSEAAVTLDPALETPDARSDAMARLLQKWRETAGLTALKGWRGEVSYGRYISAGIEGLKAVILAGIMLIL